MPNSSDPHPRSSPSESTPGQPPAGVLPADGSRLLRTYHEGVALFGERRSDVQFILDPEGRFIVPIESTALSQEHWVVVAPDESARRLEILLEPSEIERPEASASVDRWRAYHGDAPSKRWAACKVLGLRGWFDGTGSEEDGWAVFDAESLAAGSTLTACENRLLKLINTRRDVLAHVCSREARIDVAEPVCVGVDQFGLDVRARFGVVRVEFAAEAIDEARATALIEQMMNAENEAG